MKDKHRWDELANDVGALHEVRWITRWFWGFTYVQFSQHIRHYVERRGAGAAIHGVAIEKVLGICKGSAHRRNRAWLVRFGLD